ncbi:MAG: DUF1467 family protein [Parvularculaceae bacterium]|nr:DUF1467 family protein [Parvularculaceae bacterium]
MHPVAAIVIYILVWWCIFFAMLPIGVTSRWESDEEKVEGADPGAPTDPNLKKKVLWTSLAAVPVAAIVIAVILSGLINFRD